MQKMDYFKRLFGKATIDGYDSEELPNDRKIELEYYQIENKQSNKPYGVEIIKRSVQDDIMNIEDKTVYHICNQEAENKRLLEILMLNKVTPIIVDDVICDLSKEKVIWFFKSFFYWLKILAKKVNMFYDIFAVFMGEGGNNGR